MIEAAEWRETREGLIEEDECIIPFHQDDSSEGESLRYTHQPVGHGYPREM